MAITTRSNRAAAYFAASAIASAEPAAASSASLGAAELWMARIPSQVASASRNSAMAS